MDEYNRLKQCIPSNKSFKQIYNNISNVFTYYFNAKLANEILNAFKTICKIEQYRNVQIINNDICNIKSSKLISYIYNKTYKYINSNINNINFQSVLSQFLKYIINGQTLDYIQKQSHKIPPITYHNKDESCLTQLKQQMLQIFGNIFDSQTKNKIIKCCFDYIKEQEFDNIDRIKDDLEFGEQSEILNVIFENMSTGHTNNTAIKPTVGININSQHENYKYIITQNMLNIVTDLMHDRKRFNIKNFIFTEGNSCPDRNNNAYDSVHICKQIELINGFPILIWLVDMFSRDRINKFKEMKSSYAISKWLKHNIFCKFINERNPRMAEKIRNTVKGLVRRNLPSIQFNPYYLLCDSLDMFAKYTLCFHEFACEILKYYQCAPIQLDFMIIPETIVCKKQEQYQNNNNNNMNYDDEKFIYFKDKDYF
eukprot:261096_1